jgi:hypothetical protein
VPGPGVYYLQVYFGEKLANERMLALLEGEALSNGEE